MLNFNRPSSAVLGIVLLLFTASCSESIEQAASPLYDVTFTGVNVPVVNVETKSTAAGLQSFDNEVPAGITWLNMGVYREGTSDGYYMDDFYGSGIPETVKVPALPAGVYNAYFSTWGTDIYDYLSFPNPLYLWRQSIDLNQDLDYAVDMKLESGAFTIDVKEGQVFDGDLYERFDVVYEAKNLNQTRLYTTDEYNHGSDYEYGYNTTYYYKADQAYWPTETHHYMPNTFRVTAIQLYDNQGILVKTIEIDNVEFEIEVGKHTTLVVDIDELCCICEQPSGEFMLSWENVDWTEEIIEIN